MGQKLGYLETFGLLGMSPMFHLTYSKMDPADMRAVLAKKYDEEDMGPQANIVKTRQEAVRKQAVAHNFLWGVSGTWAGLVWWSFRRYNYQSRLVALPFVFYGGTFVGRVVGDVVTGRNAEFARDRFLASLPAKVYYSKMDPGGMKAVLSKKYDDEDTTPVVNILRCRQEAVRKQAVAHNFLWGTSGAMAGLVWWSFRRYNYQSRLVALPFIFYGGTFVGRVVGDVISGRNAEFARDRFLASLPAKVYYDA